MDVFDTVDASWSTLTTEMPNVSSDLSAFVHDGKIYVLGGRKLRKLSPGLQDLQDSFNDDRMKRSFHKLPVT